MQPRSQCKSDCPFLAGCKCPGISSITACVEGSTWMGRKLSPRSWVASTLGWLSQEWDLAQGSASSAAVG